MVPECFDRYDFDYIALELFDFRGPRSGAKIGHARCTLRDLFSSVFGTKVAGHSNVMEPGVLNRLKY